MYKDSKVHKDDAISVNLETVHIFYLSAQEWHMAIQGSFT